MHRILFVCTGNTCRSPMAEAILKSKNLKNIEVKSAGVFAAIGNGPSANARKAWEENAIQHDHQSKPVTKELVDWATLIFTMTASHKNALIGNFPDAGRKTFTLKEFAGETMNHDVNDPYGGNLDIYRATYKELEGFIDRVIEKINRL